jgi:hypothetical protein
MAQNLKIRGKYLEILAKSKEFQALFAADAVLDELERERDNQSDELLEVATLLGGVYAIRSTIIHPVTPAALSLLWLLRSPFLGLSPKLAEIDTDIALYILATGRECFNGNISDIVERSAGFCVQHGIDMDEAQTAIYDAVRLAFRAYQMLPSSHTAENKKQDLKFDADWLSKLISMVHDITGEKPEDIMWSMSMTAAGYYVIQYCRKNGMKHIERRPDCETVRMIWARTNELGEKYLDSIGIDKKDYAI